MAFYHIRRTSISFSRLGEVNSAKSRNIENQGLAVPLNLYEDLKQDLENTANIV